MHALSIHRLDRKPVALPSAPPRGREQGEIAVRLGHQFAAPGPSSRPGVRRSRGGSRVGSRAGLSLLEAMFAIAILGLSLAAIGRLVQLGFQAAGRARIQSQAQILCDSKMAEVAAGALKPENPHTRSAGDGRRRRWGLVVRAPALQPRHHVLVQHEGAADIRFLDRQAGLPDLSGIGFDVGGDRLAQALTLRRMSGLAHQASGAPK